ncbi:hypothetical protein PtA15_7A239 [Puccinia triticina]|uniref:Uncharacterized protein n=1 Tax=Puccinia triticina TaxID=208348 RepID=A0ABY7CMQ4_9BASI|nr:uncharacterized protein PtA15_7A239 [Puccinia triticina]WAQ86513.1 hypothetical protein PtA15_7A239 [Puccinia triticina]
MVALASQEQKSSQSESESQSSSSSSSNSDIQSNSPSESQDSARLGVLRGSNDSLIELGGGNCDLYYDCMVPTRPFFTYADLLTLSLTHGLNNQSPRKLSAHEQTTLATIPRDIHTVLQGPE